MIGMQGQLVIGRKRFSQEVFKKKRGEEDKVVNEEDKRKMTLRLNERTFVAQKLTNNHWT